MNSYAAYNPTLISSFLFFLCVLKGYPDVLGT